MTAPLLAVLATSVLSTSGVSTSGLARTPAPVPVPPPGGSGAAACGLSGALCDATAGAAGGTGATSTLGTAPGLAGSPFEQMTGALSAAFTRIVGLLLTFWTGSGDATSAGAGAGIARLLAEYTLPLTVTTATIGVVIAGTRMAIASSRAQEPARDLLRGLVILALVWWGGAYFLRTLSDAFDEAGRHVLASAGVGTGSASNLGTVLASLTVTDSGLVFLLSLVGALSGLAQFLILLLREPALALLAGALPVAAGASMTGAGLVYLKRLLAWTVAFTVYTFVAAVIYAAAFVVMGTAADLGGVISGVALVVAAVAALPAMIRLMAPMTRASSSGGLGDATAGGGDIAPGAMVLSGRGRQQAAGGAPSDAGPQARPSLLAPTGSGLTALSSRLRATSAPASPGSAVGGPSAGPRTRGPQVRRPQQQPDDAGGTSDGSRGGASDGSRGDSAAGPGDGSTGRTGWPPGPASTAGRGGVAGGGGLGPWSRDGRGELR